MRILRVGIVAAFLLTLFYVSIAAGQSLTLGSIAGRVTDRTGAVIADAKAGLKSPDTGETQMATTQREGTYRFNLLKPVGMK